MSEQRETLLRRWSELAPGECEINERSPGLGKPRISFKVPPFEGWYLHGHIVGNALILSALIEAIRARGKHYTIESYVSDEGIWAKATMILEYGNRHARRHGYAAEPCDALLSAYVQALEVTT